LVSGKEKFVVMIADIVILCKMTWGHLDRVDVRYSLGTRL
jgi:hypothetical protein